MNAPSIAIIGAGFGGIAAAIELKRRGYDDIVVLEKADDVGGVWRENTYPGAACDVPSPFYSYSFEPNPRWPHRFSRQPAILDYIRGVAVKYDVRRHIRFGTEVLGARFDEAAGRWTVEVSTGPTTGGGDPTAGGVERLEADVLVSAVGQLSRPSIPALPGLDDFQGVSFHSAEWRHDVDLTGRRVAVVGTGASAVQFVPEIQPEVEHLTVFQRSAPYLLKRPDREFSELHHRVFERLPVTQLVERGTWYGLVESLSLAWVYAKPLAALFKARARRHMKRGAKGKPGLFEQVWPDYPIGCKRVLFSDDYLPALAQPNADLVTDPIDRVTPHGVMTADGVEHEADVIVWGTGFQATDFLAPMAITGVGGRDLHETWSDGAHAYYGMTVPDFPNLLVMYGPNTNTGGGSIIYFLEAQARYLGDHVDHVAEADAALHVRPEVEAEHDERIQGKLTDSVWSQCTSWYTTASGRVVTNWPLLGIEYKSQARYDRSDYVEVS